MVVVSVQGQSPSLHIGGRWSRTVNKDQNRFHMMSTTLGMIINCHYEEWQRSVSKPDALGMAPRFQLFHACPAMKSGQEILDGHTFHGALGKPAPQHTSEGIVASIVDTLKFMDEFNAASAPGYCKRLQCHKVFLDDRSVDLFCVYFNKYTIKQE